MKRMIAALTAATALALAGLACGSSTSPSPPDAGASSGGASGGSSTCRIFPTAATVTVTTAGITQNLTLTGSFNASNNQSTVATVFANGNTCTTTVNSYRSTADFVDEVRVIPPLPFQTGTTTTNGAGCGGSTSNVTYVYDAQRRLVSFTSTGGIGNITASGTTTYSAWDASGRATSGGFAGATISNVYDDGARTLTQTQVANGSTTTNTITFDANGTNTQIVSRTGNITSTTTFTVTATGRVCK